MENGISEIIDNFKIQSYEILNQFSIVKNLIKIYDYKVILYGGGNNIGLMIRWLKSEEIYPQYIIDKDKSKSGKIVENVEIINPDMIENKISNTSTCFTFITTSYFKGLEQAQITTLLHRYGLDKYFYLIDVMWQSYFNKNSYAVQFLNNKQKLLNLYNLFEDDESKLTLKEYVRIFIENDRYRKNQILTKDKYWGTVNGHNSLYKHLSDEVFVNCGAFIGDSIYSFIANNYKFDSIYAFEGDESNIYDLNSNIDLLPDDKKNKITVINQFLSGENTEYSIDNYFKDKIVTLINMDIEGYEIELLEGAKNIIRNNKPVLAICVYHRASDLWEITDLVKSCCDEYKFYLRKYVSTVYTDKQNTELVLYAIPKSRALL